MAFMKQLLYSKLVLCQSLARKTQIFAKFTFFNNFDLQRKSINQSQIAQCEVTRITNLRSTSSSTQKLATNVTLNAIHICPCEKKPRRVRMMMSSSRPFCQILSPSILTLHFELPYLENKGIVQFVVMTINDYLLKRECNQSTKPHFIFFAERTQKHHRRTWKIKPM